MKRPHARWLLSILLAASLPAVAGESFSDLFSDGRPILDLRYRFEQASQDNALRDADAHTLRTRIGFRSGDWRGLSWLAELDDVRHLDGRFNDSRNGRSDRVVIADPDGTALNQAWLRYGGDRGGITVGRQRINLGNQRFVGGVAWRQNEQTYDAARVQFSPREDLEVGYAWIDRILSIFGPDDGPHANAANRARIDSDSHLLDLRYTFSPAIAVSAYHYRLDLGATPVTASAPAGTLSSATSGLRASGSIGGFGYALEHARQRDIAGNPWALDSRYDLLELAYAWEPVQIKVGYEVLGGADGAGNRAFQTPLATKHLFQGWADQFLVTPANGVEDRYLGVMVPLAGGTMQAWYHDFSAERGGGDHGRELDVSFARAIPGVKGLTALLKYARYDADSASSSVDTRKFWLQLQYAY